MTKTTLRNDDLPASPACGWIRAALVRQGGLTRVGPVPVDAAAAAEVSTAAQENNGEREGLTAASTAKLVTIFILASIVTPVAGVLLEQSGDRLADLLGMNGVVFGATVLALASALPEISTAITGVQMKRYTLVFGDIVAATPSSSPFRARVAARAHPRKACQRLDRNGRSGDDDHLCEPRHQRVRSGRCKNATGVAGAVARRPQPLHVLS